jgi:hypothetical protein
MILLKSQSGTVIPIFVSGLILIGLNIYDLIKEENNVYVELFFSFIASSLILLYMSYFIKDILFYPRHSNIGQLLIPLCVILISPFGLTVIKTFLKDEQYKNIYQLE